MKKEEDVNEWMKKWMNEIILLQPARPECWYGCVEAIEIAAGSEKNLERRDNKHKGKQEVREVWD